MMCYGCNKPKSAIFRDTHLCLECTAQERKRPKRMADKGLNKPRWAETMLKNAVVEEHKKLVPFRREDFR